MRADFHEKLDQILAEDATKISIRAPTTVLTIGTTQTGLITTWIEDYVHRIWLDTTDVEAYQDGMEQGGITGFDTRIVVLMDILEEDISAAQGVITEIVF